MTTAATIGADALTYVPVVFDYPKIGRVVVPGSRTVPVHCAFGTYRNRYGRRATWSMAELSISAAMVKVRAA